MEAGGVREGGGKTMEAGKFRKGWEAVGGSSRD